MDKPVFVISCPIDTYSGYGARSRDIVKAIIEMDKYDVKILSQRWGNTPFGFIKDHPEWGFLTQHILTSPQLPSQPEIWMQITVPNEFQPIGKYNIGCTAGIETTIAPAEWVEGCGRMNLILGSSEHTIKVLKESKFEKRDQQTNQPAGIIEWNGDSEVIFEGADIETYKPIKSTFDLSNVKEDFAYLFVGHWMQGHLGEDRKNVGLLIKAFYETFKNKSKKPALILKTSTVGSSYMDRDELVKRIQAIKATVKSNNLPNVYLLHGEFTNEEMNQIYNHPKVKAMVNLTKGEGFGRPLLEFSLVNKPIITTNWSGHIDYLNEEFVTLLPGNLTNVHPSAANGMLMQEAQWFSVDTGHVGHYLKDVFENYKGYAEKAKRQGFQSRTKFSFDAMKEKLNSLFTEKIPEFPKQVQLQLPQLKKIGLPKLNKIELPKLKKVEQ
jgi:glycosyltransferase involved in cell wall biosynthesis